MDDIREMIGDHCCTEQHVGTVVKEFMEIVARHLAPIWLKSPQTVLYYMPLFYKCALFIA